MYNVLIQFGDLQDSGYVYNVGDKYPHDGYSPKKARIDELSGCENAFGKPIIAEIKEAKTNKKKKGD
jgi:hypothetical protein